MLVDQDYSNILPLRCELVEGGLDGGVFCLGIYDQEVLLVVWRRCDMLGVLVSLGLFRCSSRDGNTPRCRPEAAP